jgi:hypothetical protein
MTLIAIIKFFVVVFGCTITILSGILLIKHRQLIEYFKSSFTFIREDFSAKIEVKYGNVFKESVAAIKYGIKSIRKTESADVYHDDSTNEINQILVLIGKLLVATGILGIIIILIGTIWMLWTSRINVSLY